MAKVAQAVDEKGEARSLELIANLARLFWDDVADRITLLVKTLIEEFLETRRTEVLGASSYERASSRNGHRGGSYGRRLKTKWGEVQVRVPRVAGGSYELEIIDRWGRRQVELDEAIGRLFLAGVSTRRLEKVAEELWGIGLSKAQVSEITKALDAEVARFRARKIPDTVRYLLLDGISAKVREVGVRGKVFLVAFGIHADGRREKLIAIDGGKGLAQGVKEIYPLKPVQRCLVHKIRNVLATCRRRNKAAVARSLRAIWAARTRREALAAVKAFEGEWVVEEERAVATLKRDLHQCLTYLAFPEEDHKAIRTTNALERSFREVRRRTRPMGTYVNADSADRIMFGVTEEMNERWSGVPQLAKSAS